MSEHRRAERAACLGRCALEPCPTNTMHVYMYILSHPRPDGQIEKKKKRPQPRPPNWPSPRTSGFSSDPFPMDGRGAGTRGDVSGVRRREISGTSVVGPASDGPSCPSPGGLAPAGGWLFPSQCLKRLDVGQYSCAVTSAGPQGKPDTRGARTPTATGTGTGDACSDFCF